jgi:excisionase family DNA binding protein
MSNDEVKGLQVHFPAPKALKIKGAAAVLGISEKSVRRLIDREQLKAVRVLRHLLIPVSEIDRILK